MMRKEIYITPSDKEGGVVVINKFAYTEKNNSLLNDLDTYEKISEQKQLLKHKNLTRK